jgi:hypothetical protein
MLLEECKIGAEFAAAYDFFEHATERNSAGLRPASFYRQFWILTVAPLSFVGGTDAEGLGKGRSTARRSNGTSATHWFPPPCFHFTDFSLRALARVQIIGDHAKNWPPGTGGLCADELGISGLAAAGRKVSKNHGFANLVHW